MGRLAHAAVPRRRARSRRDPGPGDAARRCGAHRLPARHVRHRRLPVRAQPHEADGRLGR